MVWGGVDERRCENTDPECKLQGSGVRDTGWWVEYPEKDGRREREFRN